MRSVFFFGGCTPKGFVSHAATLLDETDNMTIIKGGAGCGKSTFMRAVGQAAEARGLAVEYFLCSSDPDSLDCVRIPSLSVGFVDGTAPHVLEPKLCGGSANYLNFGNFYDRDAMRPNEAEIFSAQTRNKACYSRVTACLAAADRLLDCVRQETAAPRCVEEVEAIGQCLALSALKPIGDAPVLRRRFLSCVTPKGLHFCAETPRALCSRVYVLRDSYGMAPTALRLLEEKALALGHTVYRCHTPFFPDTLPAHLIIPTADAAFIRDSAAQPYHGDCFCRIELDPTLPPKTRKELAFCTDTATALLRRAVDHLRDAKAHHDTIERLCTPFVNFLAVDALTKKTIAALFD